MNQLFIVYHLPKEISVTTHMSISGDNQSLFICSIGIDTMKEDVFITYNIKEASLKHFECVELLERCIKTYPLYQAEEIIDRFKFSFQVAEAINLLGGQ